MHTKKEERRRHVYYIHGGTSTVLHCSEGQFLGITCCYLLLSEEPLFQTNVCLSLHFLG